MGFVGEGAGMLDFTGDWGLCEVKGMKESRFDDVNNISIDNYIFTNI